MWLAHLCGRPLVNGIWGTIAGWISDVWLDLGNTRVAAIEVCEPDRMHFSCVEPFFLQRSTRFGFAIDADPERWDVIERDARWVSVRSIADVLVVSPDGEWSCVLSDADCDPRTWRISRFQIRRDWWQLFARPTLAADDVLDGGADVLVINTG